MAGLEHIGNLAAVDEDCHLSGPHDQLGSVFDFVLIPGKPPGQRAAGVIDPLDNVDQFTTQLIKESHLTILQSCQTAGRSVQAFYARGLRDFKSDEGGGLNP